MINDSLNLDQIYANPNGPEGQQLQKFLWQHHINPKADPKLCKKDKLCSHTLIKIPSADSNVAIYEALAQLKRKPDAFLGKGSYGRVKKNVYIITVTKDTLKILLSTSAIKIMHIPPIPKNKKNELGQKVDFARIIHSKITMSVFSRTRKTPKRVKFNENFYDCMQTEYTVMPYFGRRNLFTISQPELGDLLKRITLAQQFMLQVERLHGSEKLHCDIKPANCVISDDGCMLKLIDFDWSRDDKPNHPRIKLEKQLQVGTPIYMPHEIFQTGWTKAGEIFCCAAVLLRLFGVTKPEIERETACNSFCGYMSYIQILSSFVFSTQGLCPKYGIPNLINAMMNKKLELRWTAFQVIEELARIKYVCKKSGDYKVGNPPSRCAIQ